MLEFVCVVYFTNDLADYEYVGHMYSCAECNNYVAEEYGEVEWVKCLHEDYIILPKGFIKKEIDYGKGK